MNFSKFFISRPIFAAVLSLLILIAGAISLFQLPISEYPEVVPPTVVVRANFPGANPKVIGETVAAPLEQAITGVENMLYMSSQSTADGKLTLTITFALGTDLDNAQVQVQNRVTRTQPKLPEEVTRIGITVDKASPDLTMVVHLTSPDQRYDMLYLSNYAILNIKDELARLGGVGDVQLFGMGDYSLRVWLDPNKTASRNLTATDVVTAIREQNRQVAAGALGAQPAPSDTSFQLSVNTQGRLVTEEEFENIVIRAGANGEITRLKDIARVELGSSQYALRSLIDNQPAVAIPIFQRPGSNAIDISNDVRSKMAELKKSFPAGMDYRIAYDPTIFVRGSIEAVVHTLFEALILVVLVVILFLQTWRASIIPLVAVPVSLIGTFAVMHLFGFSLNALSLFGLVLAIGIVVDDAIVVVENIHRHIEEGKTPLDAAIEGAREIAMPVVSMTITLAAVYAPIGFLTGLTGALFKEFALTLAGAVVISGIVALTLSPMMCAFLLRHDENPSGLAHRLDLIFEGLKRRYQRLLHGTLNTRPVVLVFAVIVLCLIPVLLTFTKSELAPDEDQGIIFMLANAPQPTNLDYLNTYTDEFIGIFKAFPEYYSSFQINGFNGVQSGIGGFLLKPWNERDRTQMEILPAVQSKLESIPGLQVFGFNLPSLPGTGEGLPFQFVVNTANDYESLLQVMDRVKKRAMESGKFAFVDVDLAFDKPEVVVDIDRAKAAQMGVSMQDLGGTLATLLGEAEINRFTIEGRSYKVIAQVERPFRDNPDWLNNYYVKNSKGELLALSTLITVTDRARPRQLNQFQQLNSAILSGVPLVSMGEALDAVRQIAGEEAPAGFAVDYAGASRQYVQEGSALWVTFALALAIIFLVLAAQFESFRDPLVILVTVPLSICGALIPLFLGWSSMNIYTQVGLVTLIGLISKHGILIVEFANQLRKDKGLTPREAVEEAAAIRLRPVLMTTAAMVFGMVPLIIATGAGAVSRFDIGTVIATGMSIGTLFTLFVLPCVYTLLAKPDKPVNA